MEQPEKNPVFQYVGPTWKGRAAAQHATAKKGWRRRGPGVVCWAEHDIEYEKC